MANIVHYPICDGCSAPLFTRPSPAVRRDVKLIPQITEKSFDTEKIKEDELKHFLCWMEQTPVSCHLLDKTGFSCINLNPEVPIAGCQHLFHNPCLLLHIQSEVAAGLKAAKSKSKLHGARIFIKCPVEDCLAHFTHPSQVVSFGRWGNMTVKSAKIITEEVRRERETLEGENALLRESCRQLALALKSSKLN